MSDAWTNEIDLADQYQPNVVDTDTLAGLKIVQGPIDDINKIQFDFHGYDIPEADMVKKSGHHGLSHSYMDFSSRESGEDKGRFLSNLDDARNFSYSDAVIDRIDGQ